jgi:CheY-like chemotaxis protein
MAAAVESPPRQKNERPGRLRILLVEDEDLVRETYAEALAASGHEVASFSGGGEALAALSSRKFDVVVTDLAMPRMSGLEVSKRVKALDPGLPVILLSGWAMQQDDAAAKEAGLDYILAKPCLIENLLETVRRAAGSKVKV